MRKLLALLLVMGLAVFSSNLVYAQDEQGTEYTDTTQAEAPAEEPAAEEPATEEAAPEAEDTTEE